MQVTFQTSITGRVRTWNAECEKALGYSGVEVLHRPFSHLLTLSAKARYAEKILECRREAEQIDIEVVHAKGHLVRLHLTLMPQFKGTGDIDGYIFMLQSSDSAEAASSLPAPFDNHFQRLLDCLAGTFYVMDRSGRFLIWNKKFEKVTKMSAREVAAANVLDFFDPRDRDSLQEKIHEVFEHGHAVIEVDLLAKDDTTVPYIFGGARLELNGESYLCGMGLDISRQKKQEELLRLCSRALNASVNGIVITQHGAKDNTAVYINPAFERITGYAAAEVIGRDLRFMAAPGLDEHERQKIRLALNEQREIHVVFRNLRKNGELFWNELTIAPVQNNRNETTHFIGVINDVTAAKQRAVHLEHEANHDALTGLANRNLFWDRLEQALHAARRSKDLVAVVYIDLDGFKLINDTEGHEAGDEVLRAISKRLKASVRENDTVARMGGDEFVLILANQPSLRFTLRMIERLRESVSKPVRVGDRELNAGASVGVSVFPHDGSSGGALLQAADAAMYHAKSLGRNTVQFFSAEMRSTIEAKHEMERSLRNALDKNELFLVFQPTVCMRSARIAGAEALLRWRHPERGILSPASFMPIAEESGLILKLGEWVLTNACLMLRHFQQQGRTDFTISLNVSLKEFGRPDYGVMLDQKLGMFGIAPDRLEIEVAENTLMRNCQYSSNLLSDLSQLGVKLAIDDFGAGFSSLSYLQKLPVTKLKIDRSLIADVSMEGADAVITKTVITMGHNLNMNVVAKGVETGDQLRFLKRHGCDQLQGNYFSSPVLGTELERLVKENATLRF